MNKKVDGVRGWSTLTARRSMSITTTNKQRRLYGSSVPKPKRSTKIKTRPTNQSRPKHRAAPSQAKLNDSTQDGKRFWKRPNRGGSKGRPRPRGQGHAREAPAEGNEVRRPGLKFYLWEQFGATLSIFRSRKRSPSPRKGRIDRHVYKVTELGHYLRGVFLCDFVPDRTHLFYLWHMTALVSTIRSLPIQTSSIQSSSLVDNIF